MLEYTIFCDESIKDGNLFSNFYGGAIVSSEHLEEVIQALEAKKNILNLHQEIKWSKITENYRDKYLEVLSLFFDFYSARKDKNTDNVY